MPPSLKKPVATNQHVVVGCMTPTFIRARLTLFCSLHDRWVLISRCSWKHTTAMDNPLQGFRESIFEDVACKQVFKGVSVVPLRKGVKVVKD